MNALFQKFNIKFKVIQSAPHHHETGAPTLSQALPAHEKGPRRALGACSLMNDTATNDRASWERDTR